METVDSNANVAVGAHRDLLDIIDSLRSQGVSRYVDLPEIIVCGDQSSGKSSVLEAISGMPFPIRDGLCTRFATELVLRRGPEANFKVSITPGEDRFGEYKDRLENWQPKASMDKDDLSIVTEEAKRIMADPPGNGEFYKDILRIELTGPAQPHLTMVDLPGLFRSGNKEQSDADADIVRGMVGGYMARPRSIILTVVSAKYEYVLQEVTSMAKRADPEGIRTMGLITKPDTLDVGSESENYFFRLTQNLEEKLRLGWHVLKNRKYEEANATTTERDELEKEFFSQGLWSSIDSTHCGVEALRVRLSTILKDQILDQLPSLVKDVEDGVKDCTERLDRLGPVRSNHKQQLSYLLRVSEEYTSLATQAVNGTYIDNFFGNRNNIEKFRTRLRAVVQNRLREFGEEMRLNGQKQHIVDSESEDENGREIRDLPRIPRSQYVEEITSRFKFNKGRELPGLFDPLIVNDLFVEQCEPWRKIAMSLTEDILEGAQFTTQLIVERITASDVTESILKLVRQEIENLKVEMIDQVNALLESVTQHPITYNPQFTKNVQKVQQARHKRVMKKLVYKTFGTTRFDSPESRISLNPIELVDLVEEVFEPDMDRFGSSMVVDYMESYYEVAMNRFIDDVSVLAIEDCLISKLSTLFRSDKIVRMTDEDILRLAGETQESKLERKRLETKLGILETGLQGLQSLRRRRSLVNSTKQDEVKLGDPEKIMAEPDSRSEKLSPTTSSVGAAPLAPTPGAPSHISIEDKELPKVDNWMFQTPFQAEPEIEVADNWPKPVRKSKKKVSRPTIIDEDQF
ncbi:hypothetical protein FSARC_14867 [Fusarium sarcochroum]|uniref:Interferon-induced GTP-binding protein Mx n=1 Tax=Fusarium sarcochroum TaxID=1208366 RepID=A0A8H4WN41_9HYPO|nr:hypothetical protein FSARC_14867 [Fusarium sarcochroum]